MQKVLPEFLLLKSKCIESVPCIFWFLKRRIFHLGSLVILDCFRSIQLNQYNSMNTSPSEFCKHIQDVGHSGLCTNILLIRPAGIYLPLSLETETAVWVSSENPWSANDADFGKCVRRTIIRPEGFSEVSVQDIQRVSTTLLWF